MQPTMSCAIARLEYGAWSQVEGGQLLRSYPRRSAQTTVKLLESAGATECHMLLVSGKPCRRSNGAPAPPRRRKIFEAPMSSVSAENPSNIGQYRQLAVTDWGGR